MTEAERTNGSDQTALVQAAWSGDLESMRALLAKGVDPVTARGESGWNALDAASASNHARAIDLLIGAGRYGALELSDALAKAVSFGQPRALRALIRHGADVDAPYSDSSSQWRPLHLAAAVVDERATGLEVMEMLLNHGADPNGRDAENNTPFHTLATGLEFKAGNPDVRARAGRMLLDAGAAPNHANNAGDLPEGLARKKRFLALAELLHKAMLPQTHTRY